MRELENGCDVPPLTAKEKDIHEAGLVSVLKDIHDSIDRTVFEAYGWADLIPALVGKPGATMPSPHKTPEQRFRRRVQQRSELLLRLPRCCLPYPLRRLCHARPALCPVRALASRIPLGSSPSLRRLRRNRGPFVRRPHRYYGQIRLLQPVHHRFGLSPLFRGPGTTTGADWSPLRSPAWTYVRAWVLRRRGALAPSRKRAVSVAFGR